MTAAERAAEVTSETAAEPKSAGTSWTGLIVPSYEILNSSGHRAAITGAGGLLAGTVTSLTPSHV